jgi:hypothetical protein
MMNLLLVLAAAHAVSASPNILFNNELIPKIDHALPVLRTAWSGGISRSLKGKTYRCAVLVVKPPSDSGRMNKFTQFLAGGKVLALRKRRLKYGCRRTSMKISASSLSRMLRLGW